MPDDAIGGAANLAEAGRDHDHQPEESDGRMESDGRPIHPKVVKILVGVGVGCSDCSERAHQVQGSLWYQCYPASDHQVQGSLVELTIIPFSTSTLQQVF